MHELAVVEHSGVGDAGMVVGKVFEVLVVGRNDAVGAVLQEARKHGLCYGSADLGLGASSELVDENKAVVVARFHHLLHVLQMAGVGAEVVFQTLFVPDVNE